LFVAVSFIDSLSDFVMDRVIADMTEEFETIFDEFAEKFLNDI